MKNFRSDDCDCFEIMNIEVGNEQFEESDREQVSQLTVGRPSFSKHAKIIFK